MIPLYGFLEGDTIGLLVLCSGKSTLAELAEKLQQAARVRVARQDHVKVLFRGQLLDPRLTVQQAGLEPLERFDVVAQSR